MRRRAVTIAGFLLTVALSGCGQASTAAGPSSAAPTSRSAAPGVLHWRGFVRADTPVDLAGPRPDGSLVLAAAGRLRLLDSSGRLRAFPSTYRGGGGEPYIAVFSPVGRHAVCFGPGTVYALEPGGSPGVLAVRAGGKPRQLAHLSAPGLLNGIAFDRTGRFGYRLLVTVNSKLTTTVFAIDCRGRVSTITTAAPRMEGGIAVAPGSFGRFAGDLIAPDEIGGSIFAVTPRGKSMLVTRSGLSHGQDVGVESEGFIPPQHRFEVLVSDRLTPGNPHPGNNLILRIGSAALRAAGVGPGDLLVVSEGGALTDAVRCAQNGCATRFVATGPADAHIEGHVAVLPR